MILPSHHQEKDRYSSVGYMGNHVYIHLDQGPRVASFLLPKWHLLEGAVINIYTYRYCTEYIYIYIWVFPKNIGKTPKMDGENNGKPYEQMDDLGGFTPLFLVQTPIYI